MANAIKTVKHVVQRGAPYWLTLWRVWFDELDRTMRSGPAKHHQIQQRVGAQTVGAMYGNTASLIPKLPPESLGVRSLSLEPGTPSALAITGWVL